MPRTVIHGLTAALVAALVPGSAAFAETGGKSLPESPEVRSVRCVPTTRLVCPTPATAVRGAHLLVKGKELEATSAVVFRGRRGRTDDVIAEPHRVEAEAVEVVVPARAKSGPLTVVSSLGPRVPAPRRLVVKSPPRVRPVDAAPESSFFYAGQRKPSFSFNVEAAMTARVELLQVSDGSVIRSWDVPAEPGRVNEVRWDGQTADGRPAANGGYRFRLAGDASSAATPSAESAVDFGYLDHVFPIRGRHNFGFSDTNNFGGGRGHKGQDMFAACGTRLAAARGGTVEYAGFHSAAGNYLVIDGKGTDVDYVYMHMLKPALVKTGDRVFTGQAIGEVGETGRATGCHLHFELWSGPGWYAGGEAYDPLPSLRSWDAVS